MFCYAPPTPSSFIGILFSLTFIVVFHRRWSFGRSLCAFAHFIVHIQPTSRSVLKSEAQTAFRNSAAPCVLAVWRFLFLFWEFWVVLPHCWDLGVGVFFYVICGWSLVLIQFYSNVVLSNRFHFIGQFQQAAIAKIHWVSHLRLHPHWKKIIATAFSVDSRREKCHTLCFHYVYNYGKSKYCNKTMIMERYKLRTKMAWRSDEALFLRSR